MLQTDAEARTRAVQGPLFKPKTPEYEYELKSRYRKAENQALSKIQHSRQDMADIPKYDEAGQQVGHKYNLTVLFPLSTYTPCSAFVYGIVCFHL